MARNDSAPAARSSAITGGLYRPPEPQPILKVVNSAQTHCAHWRMIAYRRLRPCGRRWRLRDPKRSRLSTDGGQHVNITSLFHLAYYAI
jgi:hypothetical protein